MPGYSLNLIVRNEAANLAAGLPVVNVAYARFYRTIAECRSTDWPQDLWAIV
jgi:hypothetical protein